MRIRSVSRGIALATPRTIAIVRTIIVHSVPCSITCDAASIFSDSDTAYSDWRGVTVSREFLPSLFPTTAIIINTSAEGMGLTDIVTTLKQKRKNNEKETVAGELLLRKHKTHAAAAAAMVEDEEVPVVFPLELKVSETLKFVVEKLQRLQMEKLVTKQEYIMLAELPKYQVVRQSIEVHQTAYSYAALINGIIERGRERFQIRTHFTSYSPRAYSSTWRELSRGDRDQRDRILSETKSTPTRAKVMYCTRATTFFCRSVMLELAPER